MTATWLVLSIIGGWLLLGAVAVWGGQRLARHRERHGNPGGDP